MQTHQSIILTRGKPFSRQTGRRYSINYFQIGYSRFLGKGYKLKFFLAFSRRILQ